ncbi:MAG: nodulation protein NfeD [Caldilineaceae bacterium]|nr:nodulation protein NfeD [Caldilineaceae bacterium]
MDKIIRWVRLLSLTLLLLGLVGSATSALAAPAVQNNGAAIVVVLTYDGAVTPVLDQYLADGIATATERNAAAVVLQLDTPGGSVEVTNAITQRMLSAPVPVIVYVAPSGARAGSAGTFITLAGHVAAMAPGTSIGAASPVNADGGDIDETLQAKIENILSADIENLAERRGEDAVEWALAAVQDAQAATAKEALELGVIDVIAADLDDLYAQLDGFSVSVQGEERTLMLDDAVTHTLELTPLQQFFNFISNPSVASILLTLGTLGLIVEMRAPGFGAAGIVGLICLLLAFYALGQLDASLAGLALLVVGLGLFVAEIFTPTFGVLAVGGAIAFILGAVLLFDEPGLSVPWPTLLLTAGLLLAFTLFAGSKGLLAQNRRPVTGAEGLIGQRATVKTDFAAGETGSVFVAGEWWNARLEQGAVEKGNQVKVAGKDGYTLVVEKTENNG